MNIQRQKFANISKPFFVCFEFSGNVGKHKRSEEVVVGDQSRLTSTGLSKASLLL